MRRTLTRLMPILLLAVLAACGSKGPLELPADAPAQPAQPAQPEQPEQPAQ